MSLIQLSDISVVIPYYRSLDTLTDTLDSLLREGILVGRIILVDDYSDDGIKDFLLKYYPGVTYFCNISNKGAAYSRNVGISHADTEYILFIDSDVSFNKGELSKLLHEKESDIIFPKVIYKDGSIMTPNNKWEERYCMCSAVFFAKRSAIMKLDELFDIEYFIYNEDSDFFLRCRSFEFSFLYSRNAIFFHPKKHVYSERGYYLRTRNVIYLSLKLGWVVDMRVPVIIYALGYTFSNFIIALTNRHITFSPLRFHSEIKYSERKFSQVRLLFLFFKGMFWNIYKIPVLIKKRKNLKKTLVGFYTGSKG